MTENENKNHSPKKNKSLKNWAFFVGIALQMALIIGGSIWLGVYLDSRFSTTFPWFTVGFSLIGVGASIAHVILELKRFLE